MYYEEGTGSYQNDFLEKILDTDYLFDVPYKINKEAYNTILEEYNQKTRFHDANVVLFRCDYNLEDDHDETTEVTSRGFFIWPQNSPEGSNDFYDAILFGFGTGLTVDVYEQFVKDILGCVVCVDLDHAKELKDGLCKQMAVLRDNIDIIDGLIIK